MRKRTNRLDVDIVDGEIEISQPPDEGDHMPIRVSADQVDQLVEWLKEKRDELRKTNA